MRTKIVLMWTVFLASMLLAACPLKQNLSLDLRANAQRTQTQTEFTIVGTGFSPSQPVTISLMFEPGRSVNSYEIRTVTTDAAGTFTTNYTARYMPGPDPGTRNPAFVARDNASGQSKIAEVSSSYWYP